MRISDWSSDVCSSDLYSHLHPNDDVNLSQSTNDVYPSAVRLAVMLSHAELMKALDNLAYEFRQRGVEFADIIKLGRTQLQDAVPKIGRASCRERVCQEV